MYYQIGTLEPRQCIGSRAAKSDILEEAIHECYERSLSRSVKEAWLRSVDKDGKMSNVIVVFINGHRVEG